MGRGAVEFVVMGFPDAYVDPGLPADLRVQIDRGTIRIIDMLFLQKNAAGQVRSVELDELATETSFASFSGIAQALDGLIAPDDVIEISEDLEPSTSALIVLFEHLWLRDLRDSVESSGGQVMFAERIPGEVVDAVAEAAARQS